ncbi:MAG TPA: metal-sulfur cluster assembly factor [Gemmatimonadaceae bacterium]|nr:metal-sulfur cluster assembly factor [Gemmatimonadaceae bacterium]
MDLPGTPTPPPSATAAPAAAPSEGAAAPTFDASEPPPTVDQVKMALRRVKDPDLNLNIIDLGLVYDIAVEDRSVKVDMSLTSPACPSGPQLMGDTERAAKGVPGVADVTVNLVWSPLWSPDRIEPRVRAYLGF